MTHSAENDAPCRFGYTEYDGARYCHEHAGFLEAGVPSVRCDRAIAYRCNRCGSPVAQSPCRYSDVPCDGRMVRVIPPEGTQP